MGVGERRGGRRAGGRRRANHHRHNHHHHHNRRRRHHRHGGGGGGALFAFRWGNRTGTSGPGGTPGVGVTPLGKQALLIIFSMFCMVGFFIGMTMAYVGGWTSTALGIVGMVFLLISFVFIIIVVVLFCHIKKKSAASPAGGIEAGNVNSNMAVSCTATLGGASTTTSQVGQTSYIIQPGAVQPGGNAMGTQGYNQQPGYHGGPAQPYPQSTPNYPVAPYPPPNPNGATQYPPPTNSQYPPPTNLQYPPPTNPQYPPPTNPTAAPMPYPQTGAPPLNYTTLYPAPPPPTDGHMGVGPASEDNGVAPPPSYNDVITGNVKYDEGGGSGAT